MVRWLIDCATTALLLIDVNNNFFTAGMPFFVPSSAEILPALQELSSACRQVGLPIIYSTQRYRRDGSNLGLASHLSTLRFPPQGAVACENTAGVEICAALRPEAADIVIPKYRYSAFFNTDLESTLRGLGVDTILLAGTVTDCCVNVTAFDAFQRDFKVVVAGDATAARDAETHTVMLRTFARVVGEVATVAQIVERLRRSQPKAPTRKV